MMQRVEIKTIAFLKTSDGDYADQVSKACNEGRFSGAFWEPFASMIDARLADDEDGISSYRDHHIVRLKRVVRTTSGD